MQSHLAAQYSFAIEAHIYTIFLGFEIPGCPIVLSNSRVIHSPHIVVAITSTRCNHRDRDDNDDRDDDDDDKMLVMTTATFQF